MENCKPIGTPMAPGTKIRTDPSGKSVDVRTYRGMIGSLMYLTSSRPDIMFSTCLCTRYHVDPKESHLAAIKRIFRYLKGTADLGLWYPKDTGFELIAYSDADHAVCMLDRKSTSAEYVAAASFCSQILWMRTQVRDYGFKFDKIPIYCDSKSAIAISANPVQHTKTKHIDVSCFDMILRLVQNDRSLQDHIVMTSADFMRFKTKRKDGYIVRIGKGSEAQLDRSVINFEEIKVKDQPKEEDCNQIELKKGKIVLLNLFVMILNPNGEIVRA
ncbi:hypothetical protein L6452_30922 [Arctium lappa]|uniref:Uncharacterized protein n=1 Tax=Arctium lappa TaxID=4217 RepID=A0ACB8ZNX2_ARCLA|nr:hypothetical protein L6452_30922 [Arctium lappa]